MERNSVSGPMGGVGLLPPLHALYWYVRPKRADLPEVGYRFWRFWEQIWYGVCTFAL